MPQAMFTQDYLKALSDELKYFFNHAFFLSSFEWLR